MKVSIIVPVYNKEEYIDDCMHSLVNQTHKDLEILLVDDGSKDSSAKICDCYANEHPDIVRVIHKENGGLVSAWKRGTSEAVGDYLLYVDCDDWIDLDMIEKLLGHATGRDDEIILCDYVIEKPDGAQTYIYQPIESGEYSGEDIAEKIYPVLLGLEDRAVSRSRCMKLFSRKLATDNMQYGDERLRFAEDTSLSIPCVLSAGRMYFLDKAAMYHYRYVEDSMAHKYDPTMYESVSIVHSITQKAIADIAIDRNGKKEIGDILLRDSQKEFIILLGYVVKNEALAPKEKYIKNIQNICCNDSIKTAIHETKIDVRHTSNRIVYMVMKHPNMIACWLLRMALVLYR